MSPEAPSARCPQCGKTFAPTVKMCPDDGTVLELKQDPMAAQLGKVLDSKYRLDSFLSQGGMGAVFKATHVMLGKTVAVKLINPELVTSPEVVRRFQREARAATALNHPNIVSVYDLGQTPEGTLYIAMEFVDGPSLKSVIATGGPIAPGRTIAILRQVASALAVAHAHKIVHRDLKPHNIMLARSAGGQDTVKLVDFGIAKTFDESTQLTMAGDAIGTPHYMAPEQAAGGQVDSRSDLYSLGVIVYEMLTGEVPFNDNSTAAILVKHLKDIPQKPSLRNPRVSISPELEAIALKCLEKDPAARFQTAEEFSAALELAAAAIPGAAAMQMDVTMPMAAAAAAPAVATAATVRVDRSAPTEPVRAAAPPPPPPPAKPAAAAPPPRPAGDTRPTAMNAAAATGPAPQSSMSSPSSKSSNKGLIVGFVALALVLVGVGVYMSRPSGPAADQTAAATTPAPAAVPASAQPDASATPATAPTPAPDQAAAQATASSAPPASSVPSAVSAPPARPAVPATPKTAAAPKAAASTVAVATPAVPPSATPPPAAAARVLQGGEPSARPAPAAAGFPEAPAVFFHCNGAPDICSPLRAAVDDALDKAGLSSVRTAARADIDVSAEADVVTENTNRQFGTTFAVRNYSIDVSGETTRTNEVVSMPPPTSVSFDPSFGSERAVEKARTVAADIVDRVKAFARKKRGG